MGIIINKRSGMFNIEAIGNYHRITFRRGFIWPFAGPKAIVDCKDGCGHIYTQRVRNKPYLGSQELKCPECGTTIHLSYMKKRYFGLGL